MSHQSPTNQHHDPRLPSIAGLISSSTPDPLVAASHHDPSDNSIRFLPPIQQLEWAEPGVIHHATHMSSVGSTGSVHLPKSLSEIKAANDELEISKTALERERCALDTMRHEVEIVKLGLERGMRGLETEKQNLEAQKDTLENERRNFEREKQIVSGCKCTTPNEFNERKDLEKVTIQQTWMDLESVQETATRAAHMLVAVGPRSYGEEVAEFLKFMLQPCFLSPGDNEAMVGIKQKLSILALAFWETTIHKNQNTSLENLKRYMIRCPETHACFAAILRLGYPNCGSTCLCPPVA
ncbi:hypothetical protein QBC38DRAFT_527340 [Podospora fimiseda]|uniref:Uncharacterized protein n=1 Tax=Podospora fimiseda TaxID=252190 RepID=A0AAN7BXX4_9PEZI|nr:hypothetical protein QBC38DRAFT_527340 [Podospora fimiseda]